MRDFRDAKAMAQTLRDVLQPKTALTRSESLELIARIFGFQDWNVLAAKIQSGGPPLRRADLDNSERQEIRLEGATLDRYVGFYQRSERSVMTITRDGDQLISRLTGQPSVALYAERKTEFFAKLVDAQISFIVDASGRAESLVLHQNGRDVSMKRIDAAEARRIEDLVAERLKSQLPSPGTEPALRRLVEGLRAGKPNYDEMGPGLADATRRFNRSALLESATAVWMSMRFSMNIMSCIGALDWIRRERFLRPGLVLDSRMHICVGHERY
jgi:Domain of unknown function (DUF3471)/Glyoxalase superfamily protein